MCRGAGDLVHFFYGSDISETPPPRAYLFHRAFDLSTLAFAGDEQVITDESADRFNGSGAPISYVSGGVTKIAIPLAHRPASSSIDRADIIEADSAAEPLWAISTVSSSNPPSIPGDVCWGDLLHDTATGQLWMFWNIQDQISGRTSIVYNSKPIGGSWGADQVFKDSPDYHYASPSPFLDGTTIRVVYTKLRSEEIAPFLAPEEILENFPHIDVVSVCPPVGAAANYAFFY
jgi:hypothetical protein